MKDLKNNLFVTNDTGKEGLAQAYSIIDHMKNKESKGDAYTALHIAVNSVAQEVIDFVEDDI